MNIVAVVFESIGMALRGQGVTFRTSHTIGGKSFGNIFGADFSICGINPKGVFDKGLCMTALAPIFSNSGMGIFVATDTVQGVVAGKVIDA
jgi:hypothetical protein